MISQFGGVVPMWIDAQTEKFEIQNRRRHPAASCFEVVVLRTTRPTQRRLVTNSWPTHHKDPPQGLQFDAFSGCVWHAGVVAADLKQALVLSLPRQWINLKYRLQNETPRTHLDLTHIDRQGPHFPPSPTSPAFVHIPPVPAQVSRLSCAPPARCSDCTLSPPPVAFP